MKTKMILVQFRWQKNVNLTVARLVVLVYPTGHMPPASRSARRGYFASLQGFRSFAQIHKRLGCPALWRTKSA